MTFLRIAAAVVVALALAGGDEAWAGKGRGGGRGASGGSSAKSSSGTRSHHRHHHARGGTVIVGTALIGSAFWYPQYPAYYPGPYYYGPDFRLRYTPPSVYIEKFDGDPGTAVNQFILCPQSDTLYPDVKECPGGWARIVRE